jgi:hypothetical protein
MTPTQAAQVLAALHGAYPRVELDDAVANVWQNSLAVSDYHVAMQAATKWIGESRFWPSIAEFNGLITEIRRDMDYQQPQLAPRPGYGCDGSGWIDRGQGWEACPTCNPWNYALLENGDWQNTRLKPPADWWQPQPCRQRSHESELFTFQQAKDAIERGYREHHEEVGTDPALVDRKAAKLLKSGPSIGSRL